MEIKSLTIEQVKQVYEESMKVDFPDNERKPLAMILKALENGTYECLGAFMEEGEVDKIVGYAFFVKTENDYLFDYLAVMKDYRNKGIGAEFLKGIAKHCENYESVIGEVEDPACAKTEDEKKLQQRRRDFYFRNGYVDTKVRVKLFGVDYLVIEMNKNVTHTEQEIKELYKKHYEAMLPKLLYKTMVKIKN